MSAPLPLLAHSHTMCTPPPPPFPSPPLCLQEHIRTFRSFLIMFILNLRFFIIPYGIVYALSVTGGNTSILVRRSILTTRAMDMLFASVVARSYGLKQHHHALLALATCGSRNRSCWLRCWEDQWSCLWCGNWFAFQVYAYSWVGFAAVVIVLWVRTHPRCMGCTVAVQGRG